MAGKNASTDWVTQELGGLIEAVELGPLQKQFLRSRWLGQVIWTEGRASYNRYWHYRMRLATIIAGACVPALIGLQPACNASLGPWYKALTVILSVVVAILTSLEGFFHFGDRWRHYRRVTEGLKTVGWQFMQLSGPFSQYSTAVEGYPAFVAKVEEYIQQDVDTFVSQVAQDKTQGSPAKAAGE
jgi:hypothetical protein